MTASTARAFAAFGPPLTSMGRPEFVVAQISFPQVDALIIRWSRVRAPPAPRQSPFFKIKRDESRPSSP